MSPGRRTTPGLCLALGFAMVWPTVMAWLYFVALAGPPGADRQPNAAVQTAYSGGKAVQFALPILCVLAWERRWPRPTAPTVRGLAYGIGSGVLIGAGILGLYFAVLRGSSLLRGVPGQITAKLEGFGLASPGGYLLLAVFLSLVHSLLEEYYWRWFVFGWLRRLVVLPTALLLSSLAFMAHHVVILAVFFPDQVLTVALPLALCVGIGGAVWAGLYERTRSIDTPWLSHLLVDAAIMAVGYDMVFHHPL